MKAFFGTKVLILIYLLSATILPQNSTQKIIVTPGTQYKVGWLHRFFAGTLWRDLWITPFEVDVLDLDKFAGGLTPLKTGGGQQTKSLHFLGKDGRRYKFRSIDKDPSRSLPPDLRESLVAEAMQDQVPVQNPVASIVVAPLMSSVGILNAEPTLFLMPDSDKLLAFRNDFSNVLGTIEENPDDYDDDELNFAGSDKVVSTFKLYERLEKDNDEQVDAIEFLKARLFDVFIGDRDRHSGQWKWAGYKFGKKRIWKPIPKDRDFAFPLYDGLIPKVMTLAVTSMVHFDYDLPSILDMTWEGRHLDRRFLGRIEKQYWDSVAAFMQHNLTDKIIEESVRRMPPELFALRGQELIDKLKSRRDLLITASDEYYKLVMMYVDLYCSDKKEFVEVIRHNDSTSVKIFKRSEKSEDEKGELLFNKIYYPYYTKEIRIHLLAGDDKLIVKGSSENGIRIIIDGGDGADELIDSSIVKGNLLGFLPIKSSIKKTEFYDSGKKTKFLLGSSTYFNTRPWIKYSSPEEKYEPDLEDRYRDFSLLFPFSINSDDGLVYGLGGRWNFYDFRVAPYSYSLSISGAHSTKSQSYEFVAAGDFNKFIEGANFNFLTTATGHEINRFYGLGNESVLDKKLKEDEFYYVAQRKYYLRGLFTFPLSSRLSFGFGLALEDTEIKRTPNSLVDLNDFIGKGRHRYFSFLSRFRYDSRDNLFSPYKGVLFELDTEQFPLLLNSPTPFGSIEIEGSTYFSGQSITHYTFAFRGYGKYLWGDYPFYKSAYVGGKNSLRGYSRNRFSGDAAVSAQAELRFILGTVTLFIPGEIGLNLFSDIGRVYLKNDSSKKWHSSQGGGLWFSILNRAFVLSLNTSYSKEEIRFYLNVGQSF